MRETRTAKVVLPEMVILPGGSFVMGNDAGRLDERPAHMVSLAPFRAAVRPVSVREYERFLLATGHEAPPFWQQAGFDEPDQPVAAVSWFDAVEYCRWLSAASGVGLRLPTEAEREYAARGGVDGADWPLGAVPDLAGPMAGLSRPHIPEPGCRNAFGLYCMAENVHEWCSDWYDAGFYATSASESPAGPAGPAARRASRGGSWRHSVKFTRVSARSSLNPSYRYNDYGFRVYADA